MLTSTSTLQPQALYTSPQLSKITSCTSLRSPLLRRSTKAPPCLALASADREKYDVGVESRKKKRKQNEMLLYSVAPYPLLFAAALPGASTVRSIFGPFVELVKTWNLPDWLVHWGHPGNMV
ncbi:uncharacterized protein A4U43_C10F15590, partial [Asparagus officinalis]